MAFVVTLALVNFFGAVGFFVNFVENPRDWVALVIGTLNLCAAAFCALFIFLTWG